MTDKDKVINGLKCITEGVPCYQGCGYYGQTEDFDDCVKAIAADALKLLEEQDKTIQSLTKEKEALMLERIAELQHNIDTLYAKMQDIILVNNAIRQRKGGEMG